MKNLKKNLLISSIISIIITIIVNVIILINRRTSSDMIQASCFCFIITFILSLFNVSLIRNIMKNKDRDIERRKQWLKQKRNNEGKSLAKYGIPILLGYFIVPFLWPLNIVLYIANIVLLKKLKSNKKNLVPLNIYRTKKVLYFLLETYYLFVFGFILLSIFNGNSITNIFYLLLNDEDSILIFVIPSAILTFFSYFKFIEILNLYVGIKSVEKTVIIENKSTNLSEEYNLSGKTINNILTTHTNDLNQIQALIESNDAVFQQIVLSVIYPKVNNFEGIIIQRFSNLQYINTNKIISELSYNLSEQEKALITKRVSQDYSTITLDNIESSISAISGIICGLIDAFFVGKPNDSKLGNVVDNTFDNIVCRFTKFIWKTDSNELKEQLGLNKKCPEGIASCIGYLEKRFKVPYDARYAKDVNLTSEELSMNPLNHHLKNLDHAPDIIGLFFSIIDQFTNSATFVSDGRLIHVDVDESKAIVLYGTNIISKIFCAFVNWLGHIMSDIVGSSGTRGHDNAKRGAGVCAPFYELFQFLDIGNLGDEQKSIADISVTLFEKGYDARFWATASLPVVLNEYIIRFSYILKLHFVNKVSWSDIKSDELLLPTKASLITHEDLRLNKMLLIGYGSFCSIDFSAAVIKGKGFNIDFLLNINLPAWKNFAIEGFIAGKAVLKRFTANPEKIEQELIKEIESLNHSESE